MRDAWVAQLVKHLTLDFDSGCDVTVYEIEPNVSPTLDRVKPSSDSLSLSRLPTPSQNKYINIKKTVLMFLS